MQTTVTPPDKHTAEDDMEDLELCAREGRHPRCVRRYRIRIDKNYHVVHVSFMTGWQLLELGGACDPRKWKIRQKMANGSLKNIPLDEKVDFTTPGIERFVTLPCDQTEGELG
jgi:Multiubiquitin